MYPVVSAKNSSSESCDKDEGLVDIAGRLEQCQESLCGPYSRLHIL
jgi:hypothetical protein